MTLREHPEPVSVITDPWFPQFIGGSIALGSYEQARGLGLPYEWAVLPLHSLPGAAMDDLSLVTECSDSRLLLRKSKGPGIDVSFSFFHQGFCSSSSPSGRRLSWRGWHTASVRLRLSSTSPRSAVGSSRSGERRSEFL